MSTRFKVAQVFLQTFVFERLHRSRSSCLCVVRLLLLCFVCVDSAVSDDKWQSCLAFEEGSLVSATSAVEAAGGNHIDHIQVVVMEGINMLLDPSFCSTKDVPREELARPWTLWSKGGRDTVICLQGI